VVPVDMTELLPVNKPLFFARDNFAMFVRKEARRSEALLESSADLHLTDLPSEKCKV
jgi:hypothetical protein